MSAASLQNHPFSLFCCPCAGRLEKSSGGWRCIKCERQISFLADAIPDFIGAVDENTVETIVNSPDAMIDPLIRWLATASANRRWTAAKDGAGSEQMLQLVPDLPYQLTEHAYQAQDPVFLKHAAAMGVSAESCVLDVGCGAGQTLRLLAPLTPQVRVGIDVRIETLALGCRLARFEQQGIEFVHARGDALPFPVGSFSHVISRVALNYMHQNTALREMARVVRPGGHVYLRIERLWHDLARLRMAGSSRELICRFRDFALGGVHAVSGFQLRPGSRLSGGRAFATLARVSSVLKNAGCLIVAVEPSSQCPKTLGQTRQLTIIAKKL